MTMPTNFRNMRFDYAYLAANYDITPMRQFKLLPNRPEPGLFQKLTDHVFQLIAEKKGGGAPFFFNTGSSSGKQLLQAAGKTMPPRSRGSRSLECRDLCLRHWSRRRRLVRR